MGEAVSWGKVGKEARYQTVYADVTIALPIIAQYILDSWVRNE
ncbi:MAG: deoxyhypusine synthase family protein [Desulfobacteraceae bacterium]|nr:deoxyhypusine synthase family protein [Desulfobacteraceae bacterium]